MISSFGFNSPLSATSSSGFCVMTYVTPNSSFATATALPSNVAVPPEKYYNINPRKT